MKILQRRLSDEKPVINGNDSMKRNTKSSTSLMVWNLTTLDFTVLALSTMLLLSLSQSMPIELGNPKDLK